jgi:hypothetical protein
MQSRSARGRRFAAIVLATVGAALTFSAGTAHAGPQHHGTNPSNVGPGATGCNLNASLIGTRPLLLGGQGDEVGVLEIYYSYSCQTNWLRVRDNTLGGRAEKRISSDGMPGIPPEVDYGYGASHSMQAYAPGSTCVNYDVWISDPTEYYVGYAGGRLC